MSVKQGRSKTPRKTKKSYRVDAKTGAKVKNTPNRGARPTRLSPLEKALIAPHYFEAAQKARRARVLNSRGASSGLGLVYLFSAVFVLAYLIEVFAR